MDSEGPHPLSILYVDDNSGFGTLVKTYLERDGSGLDCEVTTETDPADALELIQAGDAQFDCFITDYDMPRLNGIEFLEAVRETHPELPVLLFSGEHPDDIAAEIIQAGLTDYLRKGVGKGQYTMLIRRVEHAVDSDGQFDPEAETELDGVGVVGPDDCFDQADEAYAAFYGYDSEEVTGKHWTEIHPEQEVEHIRTHVLPVVEQGGKWSGHSEGLRADGSTFTESKMVTTLDDGRLLISVSELDDTPLTDEE